MKLTQALVTRYAKLSALKNLIDKWLEDKKPQILEALCHEECPDKGPYLLESKEVKNGPNWKAALVNYMRTHGRTQEEIDAYLAAQIAIEQWGTCIRLEKRINPNYRKTFTLKLPA